MPLKHGQLCRLPKKRMAGVRRRGTIPGVRQTDAHGGNSDFRLPAPQVRVAEDQNGFSAEGKPRAAGAVLYLTRLCYFSYR